MTFSFITLTKLAQFLSPIPVFKSVLNFLSASVVSFLIVFSFDLHMMQNSFTFGKILHQFFWKNTFEQKFLYWSNSTFFSSNQAKSGTIRKIIARRLIRWCWTLFFVRIGARYGGWKLTGHLISALLYKVNVMVGCGMQSNTNINTITQQLEFEVVTGCSQDCSSQTSHSRNHWRPHRISISKNEIVR